MKFDIWGIFFSENLLSKFKFHQNLTRITGTLREDRCTSTTVSRRILRITDISGKSCREKLHILFFFY